MFADIKLRDVARLQEFAGGVVRRSRRNPACVRTARYGPIFTVAALPSAAEHQAVDVIAFSNRAVPVVVLVSIERAAWSRKMFGRLPRQPCRRS